MKVRFLTTAAGPEGVFQAGRSYDIADGLAFQLLEAGAVVFLGAPERSGPVEMAIAEPPAERAVVSGGRRGRKRRGE